MIGTRLGQYRIDALLGQGGMGAVYLATDEMLGRQVAIKVLREQAEEQAIATERFRSEAQILSRLDHPHILRLYGFSQHEGLLYMVTEFVRGEALQRRLERGGPVDSHQVLEWAGQVLDALDYAHQLGVVHRDIKPANILIDERGRARLLDFGIARIVGVEGPTQTGQAVGTLTYMAPEQVLDEPIDGRADIYAFAVVLCQMLAGRRPYRATTTAGLIREIVDGPTPEVAALLPAQSAALAPALIRALARYPADRTPTAGQLRLELIAAATQPELPPLPAALPQSRTPIAPVSPSPSPVVERSSPVTVDAPVVPVVTSGAGPPAATPGTGPVAPPLQRRQPVAVLYGLAALLLLSGGGLAWYLVGPPRTNPAQVGVTPPVTSPPVDQPSPGPTAANPVTTDAPAAASVTPPPAVPPPAPAAPVTAEAPPARPAPAPTRPAAPAPRETPPRIAASPAPSQDVPTEPAAIAETTPPPAPSAAPPPVPAAAPPATSRTGVPATVQFKDIILIDRIDDEDEEIDVSMRLDARRIVVIDEDGIAKRSIAYEAIDRASYNSRKPGRFSFRRGPSHWLTLEVGTTPIVLRLNGRTYEQVLKTLSGRGVNVERNP